MLRHIDRHAYDVLLPVHEQAFLFAKVQDRLPAGLHSALAPFEAFLQVQGKVAFARLMARLGLPQPETHIAGSRSDLGQLDRYPYYLKTDYSTAGQGVWRITNRDQRDCVATDLERRGLLGGTCEVVVQQEAAGSLCQAQAVFAHGCLIAAHCTQTRGVSVGGGHAARTSVDHPEVRDHLITLGRALEWHGPLALDYLFDPSSGHPTYIEANPRLVEPMNAALSGVNLADLTVRVALGGALAPAQIGPARSGLRTHSLLAILLGTSAQGGSRRDVLRTMSEAAQHRGIFAASREDLTPIRLDPPSLIPLGVVAVQLLLRPRAAQRFSTGTVNAYSLTRAAVETIAGMN
jgi:predicted ATP-grasp superfamily ATP-dependent carboligase